jgi:hypothetical protein
MRALRFDRYGPPDVLKLVDLDEPVPRTGELKVRVDAASLNPLDAKVRAGHTRYVPMFERPPRGTGVDFAGTVVGTGGGDVGGFPGARVFSAVSPFRRAGTFAEFVCVTPAEVASTPASVTDEHAAASRSRPGRPCRRSATGRVAPGMRGARQRRRRRRRTLCGQYAHHLGAHVTATCGPDNGLRARARRRRGARLHARGHAAATVRST